MGFIAGLTRALFSSPALLVVDVFASLAILVVMKYTEVDWIAYMQEVQGYIGGEKDYVKLGGNTGPLVYPGGFVYIYGALSFVTDDGRDVALAQALFAALYILVLALVLNLYSTTSRVPFLLTALLVVSRRIHSIFMLRMFNDTVAMALLYFAVYLMTKRCWGRACLTYSLAVSVKMNVLLFAPGMLLVMLKSMSFAYVVLHLAVCAATQVVVGAPFLMDNWKSYVTKAFELSRVFNYKWTVNYKFLPEELFVAPQFGLLLLALTIASWAALWVRRWRHRHYVADASAIVQTLFESNIVGIVFSRTFHYQFYVWFFHQIPFALCMSCARLPVLLKLAVFIGVEAGFTVYPSTALSSAVLQGSLLLLWASMIVSKDSKPTKE